MRHLAGMAGTSAAVGGLMSSSDLYPSLKCSQCFVLPGAVVGRNVFSGVGLFADFLVGVLGIVSESSTRTYRTYSGIVLPFFEGDCDIFIGLIDLCKVSIQAYVKNGNLPAEDLFLCLHLTVGTLTLELAQ